MANWQASLFDRFNPNAGQNLDEEDRKRLGRAGLLQLGIGLLTNGGGFGNALGEGIKGGLLAMNQGAESITERQHKAALAAQKGEPPTSIQEFLYAQKNPEYVKYRTDIAAAARPRQHTTVNGTPVWVEDDGFTPMQAAGGQPPQGAAPPQQAPAGIDDAFQRFVRDATADATSRGEVPPSPEVLETVYRQMAAGQPIQTQTEMPQQGLLAPPQAGESPPAGKLPAWLQAAPASSGGGLLGGAAPQQPSIYDSPTPPIQMSPEIKGAWLGLTPPQRRAMVEGKAGVGMTPAQEAANLRAEQAAARAEEASRRASLGNAPEGHRFNARGELERIPGWTATGKELTGELKLKRSLFENARRSAGEWHKLVTGPNGEFNDLFARSPKAQALLKAAIGNKLRAESGAAISADEISNETARYLGGFLSSDSTNANQATMLLEDLDNQLNSLGGGSSKPPANGLSPEEQDELARLRARFGRK